MMHYMHDILEIYRPKWGKKRLLRQAQQPLFYWEWRSIAAATAMVAAAVSAAAAGDEDDGKNDEPYPVVVKKIAKTVVHKGSS